MPSSNKTASDAKRIETFNSDDLHRLTDGITELAEQVEVLRDVLDEIREDIQWAVRNDRLVALPIGCIEHTAVKRMAADPASPEGGSRLEVRTYRLPAASGVERVTQTIESVIDEVMTAAVGLSWVRDQVREQTDGAEQTLPAGADQRDDGGTPQQQIPPVPSPRSRGGLLFDLEAE